MPTYRTANKPVKAKNPQAMKAMLKVFEKIITTITGRDDKPSPAWKALGELQEGDEAAQEFVQDDLLLAATVLKLGRKHTKDDGELDKQAFGGELVREVLAFVPECMDNVEAMIKEAKDG